MKVAAIQMRMTWSTEEHLVMILAYIRKAAGLGASLVAFPEYAATGSHREIRAEAEKIRQMPDWSQDISTACREHGVWVFVGAPSFTERGIMDSYVLFDRRGRRRSESHKIGLTPSEQTFFVPGEKRTVWSVDGLKIAIVMCREIADLPDLVTDYDTEIDLLLWPCISSVQETLPDDQEQMTHQQAGRVAAQFGACLIQANWANSVNRPELTNVGGSAFFSGEGDKLSMCPLAEAGLALIDLDDHSCAWHPA